MIAEGGYGRDGRKFAVENHRQLPADIQFNNTVIFLAGSIPFLYSNPPEANDWGEHNHASAAIKNAWLNRKVGHGLRWENAANLATMSVEKFLKVFGAKIDELRDPNVFKSIC